MMTHAQIQQNGSVVIAGNRLLSMWEMQGVASLQCDSRLKAVEQSWCMLGAEDDPRGGYPSTWKILTNLTLEDLPCTHDHHTVRQRPNNKMGLSSQAYAEFRKEQETRTLFNLVRSVSAACQVVPQAGPSRQTESRSVSPTHQNIKSDRREMLQTDEAEVPPQRAAFPTEAREREKAKKQEEKASGVVRKVQKRVFKIDDCFDDCGESLEGLEPYVDANDEEIMLSETGEDHCHN